MADENGPVARIIRAVSIAIGDAIVNHEARYHSTPVAPPSTDSESLAEVSGENLGNGALTKATAVTELSGPLAEQIQNILNQPGI